MDPLAPTSEDAASILKTPALKAKLQALYAEQHKEGGDHNEKKSNRKQTSQPSLPRGVEAHTYANRDAIIGSSLDC